MESNLSRAGRGKGTPNKTTSRARKAIAVFAERNIDSTFEWLQDIKDGVYDEDNDKWIVPPDAKGALNAFLQLLEYHVPKLSRVEHTGKDGEELTITNILQSIETPVIPNAESLDVIEVEEDIDMNKLISHGIIED